jgi:prolyl oligopeptidase
MLIRIDVNAGHGAGKPTSKQIAEFGDMWSFVFYNLGIN